MGYCISIPVYRGRVRERKPCDREKGGNNERKVCRGRIASSPIHCGIHFPVHLNKAESHAPGDCQRQADCHFLRGTNQTFIAVKGKDTLPTQREPERYSIGDRIAFGGRLSRFSRYRCGRHRRQSPHRSENNTHITLYGIKPGL